MRYPRSSLSKPLTPCQVLPLHLTSCYWHSQSDPSEHRWPQTCKQCPSEPYFSTIIFLLFISSVFTLLADPAKKNRCHCFQIRCTLVLFRIGFLCVSKAQLNVNCLLASPVMRNLWLDKMMYAVFLSLQPPAPLHKAVLRSRAADLWHSAGNCFFMPLRTASIYQASAGSFDLQQDVTWSYLNEVDFGFIAANMACANLHVWVC